MKTKRKVKTQVSAQQLLQDTQYEAALRASQAMPEAQAFAAKWNSDWSAFADELAQAKDLGFIETQVSRWESARSKKSETRLDIDTDIETADLRVPNKGIDLEIAVMLNTDIAAHVKVHGVIEVRVADSKLPPKWREVTRKRKLAHGRLTNFKLTYQNLLQKIEFTTDVVLTPAQSRKLQALGVNDWGRVFCSIRRRDTGATALWLRHEDRYMLIFEDGSFVKSYRVPVFANLRSDHKNLGWHFDKLAVRDFVAQPVYTVKANVSASCFSIVRGYTDKKASKK